MRAWAPALLVAAYLLLGSAWVVANPPGASPDEYAHYLKALAAGRGELYLRRRPPPPPDAARLEPTRRWHLVTSRLVTIPPGLDPSPLLCTAFHPEVSARCTLARPGPGPSEGATIVGPYQPFTYVVPGLLMRLGHDPASATRWGRLGFWLPSAALLAVAVALLWSGDGYSLLGIVVATTPMVLFMASTLSANGIEIAAGVCMLAAIVRLGRAGGDEPWVWAAVGASGAVLALARSTGILWVVLTSLLLPALVGLRGCGRLLRRGGGVAAAAVVSVAGGLAVSLAWELSVQPHPHHTLDAAVRGLPQELRELPAVFEQAIGIFGWLDTRMAWPVYPVWKLLLVALILLAFLVGRRRQRWLLCGVLAASVGATLLVATLNRPTGFGVQARYVLPFVTVVPLMAGEIVLANRSRLGALAPPGLVLLVAATAAVVQLWAWGTNARRYAVGVRGPVLFLERAEWQPPLGWWAWLAVAGVGATALVAAGVASVRARPAAPAPPPSDRGP